MLNYGFYQGEFDHESVKFVQPMKDYMIMPLKLNMFHFYAFDNYSECIN